MCFGSGGYGGGLFLPFADATNRRSTYGGGRYLLDTVKGADLGSAGSRLILDFNLAYSPSCAYNPRWVCPLAPAGNRLDFPVPAGENTLPSDRLPGKRKIPIGTVEHTVHPSKFFFFFL